MFLIISGSLLAMCFLLIGWKFYQSIDWEEPAEPSPDLRAMHKKEAELMHIQEVLEEAAAQKKISDQVVEEFNRYCETEINGMRSIEKDWRNRPKGKQTHEGE